MTMAIWHKLGHGHVKRVNHNLLSIATDDDLPNLADLPVNHTVALKLGFTVAVTTLLAQSALEYKPTTL